jgi:hypothetical protein
MLLNINESNRLLRQKCGLPQNLTNNPTVEAKLMTTGFASKVDVAPKVGFLPQKSSGHSTQPNPGHTSR